MEKKNFFWIAASLVIIVLFALPIISSEYLRIATDFITQYPASAALLIIPLRFLAVVLAPLPGSPIAFASMAVLPWWEALAYNFIGAELGIVAAFFIARKFREPVVAHVAPLQKVHEWQDTISQTKQFWGFVGLRLVALFATDFVSYAAGLSKLSFTRFILATLLVDIPAYLVFFYIGGIAVAYSIYLYLAFIAIFALVALLWFYTRQLR